MSYNSTHTGSQIDDAVEKVLNGSVPKADKLNIDAGSATNPVYFLNGIPVKTTYTLGASVPSNAVFTDTTYGIASSSTAGLVKIGFTENGKNYPVELNSDGQMFVNVPWTDTDTNTHYKAVPHAGTNSSTSATATTNGNTYINIVENNSRSGGINVKGTGATTVTSDSNGVITINSTDTNTVTTVSTTGSGNAVTSITASNGALTVTKGSTFLTAHPTISIDTDSTTTASPSHGDNFTVVDGVARDSNGHVTKINTKTVTLPSETTLSKGTDATGTATTLTHGGTFKALTDMTVSGHTVTDVVTTFTMPSETTLSTGSATASSSLSHGGNFTAITGLSVSGHKITPTTTTYTLPSDSDTKNTAGSSNTSSKIFLIGATSQAANPQTYSHDTAYVDTDGCLYSNSTKVSVEGHTHNAVKIVRWS